MTDQPDPKPEKCKHPKERLFAWHVDDPLKPDHRILCVCCCDCGEVLAGGVGAPEKPDNSKVQP